MPTTSAGAVLPGAWWSLIQSVPRTEVKAVETDQFLEEQLSRRRKSRGPEEKIKEFKVAHFGQFDSICRC